MSTDGSPPSTLTRTMVEIERHVAEAGWDQPPQLFALVETAQLLAAEPQLAATLGLVPGAQPPGGLTPVQQEELPEGALDEALASVLFGPEVLGVALVHEVLVLPPAAEAEIGDRSDEEALAAAVGHDERREVRLVVGVLRDGSRATALRLRAVPGGPGADGASDGGMPADGATPEDDVLTGADLAPRLADALLATLEE